MKVAVVGATGLVGTEMLKVLAERQFPVTELLPVASAKSVGQEIEFQGKKYKVVSMDDAIAARPAVAIFSAGGSISKQEAPRFAEVGTVVIDNSSAWRMDPTKKLVVPEVNAHALTADDKIIANPNCSTIQMVVALNELHKRYKAQRIVVSTYQSVTGTGKKAVDQLLEERAGQTPTNPAYPHRIDLNVLPHIDVFDDSGYTGEEVKVGNETRKMLHLPDLRVSATCVRVPVMYAHSQAVHIETVEPLDAAKAREILMLAPGAIVVDEPGANAYPLPRDAAGRDEVFIGRIRNDASHPNGLALWIVADNLRKGAATNAVQIAESVVMNGWL